jgi:hypothetical protein
MKPRYQMAVFGFFFFFYMLTTSREIAWNDANLIYHTAGSIVLRGELGIPSAPGQYQYAPHPIMVPLSQVPGFMLYRWAIAQWPTGWSMAKVMTIHVGPAFFGALTCVLFLSACCALKIKRGLASFGSLLVGLGTSVWVYARSPYSEVVQAATYMGFVGSLLAFWIRPRKATAFRVGLWAALLINSKVVFVLALPAGLFVCLYRLRKHLKTFLLLSPWAMVPIAAGAWVIMLHNQARTGVVTNTGYAATQAIFSQRLWEGALGLLASPGKSVFLFAPPLILSLFGLRECARSHPYLLAILGGCSAPIFYVYAKYDAWSGDWAWGPRYMVPLMAPFLLPGLIWIQTQGAAAATWANRRKTVIVMSVAAAGLFIQILGSAFYWDHFIRISQEARNGWLGNPNRTGSRGATRPTGCDPCYEDFYPFQWLPPFSQVSGHWWLMQTVPFKENWIEATSVAPWTRYSRLHVPISKSYPAARVDLWILEFWKRFKMATLSLTVAFSLGCILCATLWWVGIRRAGGAPRHTQVSPQ